MGARCGGCGVAHCSNNPNDPRPGKYPVWRIGRHPTRGNGGVCDPGSYECKARRDIARRWGRMSLLMAACGIFLLAANVLTAMYSF